MIRYLDIQEHDEVNSDDYSVTIFFSHCEHRCEGCHNPSTWNKNSGELFDRNIIEHIFNIYRNDTYKEYGNLVLSGGDPLSFYNRKDILEFIDEFKQKFSYINIWIYTGYDFSDLNENILKNIDTIKCGRYIQELKTCDNIQYNIRLATSNQQIYKRGVDY